VKLDGFFWLSNKNERVFNKNGMLFNKTEEVFYKKGGQFYKKRDLFNKKGLFYYGTMVGHGTGPGQMLRHFFALGT
jgi:hypothetical protein